MVFLFQFGVCLGLLFVFWIPFFNDSTKAKRDAKKFEMVSQIWRFEYFVSFLWELKDKIDFLVMIVWNFYLIFRVASHNLF